VVTILMFKLIFPTKHQYA